MLDDAISPPLSLHLYDPTGRMTLDSIWENGIPDGNLFFMGPEAGGDSLLPDSETPVASLSVD